MKPLPAAERLPVLDVVRGVALLGIFIMNMPGFSTSFFAEADGSRLWDDALNKTAQIVRDVLFSGKFNSMFSLLFGIGFTIQLERMRAREPDRAQALYLRRLAWLLVFGLLHAVLLWTGDILHMYAVMGLLLLALRGVSDRTLLMIIGFTLLYPAFSGALRLVVMTPEITARLVAQDQAWELSNNLAYGQGSFLDGVRERAREFRYFYDNRWSLWGNLGFCMQIATTMLLGLLIGRSGWLHRLPELLPVVKRLQVWSLVAGVGFGVAFGVLAEFTRAPGPSPLKILAGLAYSWSRLALTAFYVLTLVRLVQPGGCKGALAPLAHVGRMPLTNYLLQSLMGVFIFHAWGLGAWGKVGPAWQLLMAPALFFGLQVPLSAWWLRHHEQGPMEALWRRLTYGAPGRP